MAIPGADVTEARKFFDMLTAKYKLTAKWDVTTLMGMNQALVAVRAIEGAVKDVGAAKLTGVAVRDSILKNPISASRPSACCPIWSTPARRRSPEGADGEHRHGDRWQVRDRR
jgi:branched-chain amino acid transport system substrate-binding protein